MAGRDACERAIDDAIRADDVTTVAAARLVYADWLDEQGDLADARLAAAQRWMAERGRRPWDHGDNPANSPARWTWSSEEHGAKPEPEFRLVPWRLFNGMAGHVNDFSWRGYPTRQQAERALAEALAVLSAEGDN